ncbi:MAG: hypothetical protein HYZ29_19785 [Myxococcales bacterium]|nr:hypothetical protein [Myxococcales bacterium]
MDPLPEPVVRAVIQRYARLIHRLGAELGERPLVLPTEKFFPDTFAGDTKSLRRLVKRMREHAGMRDIPVKPVLVDEEEEAHAHGGGGCGGGGCAVPKTSTDSPTRLVDDGDGWRLQFQSAELRHPVALTCTVARALGYVFLIETQPEGTKIEDPVELTVDLAAVALGFGELLLEGSHIYSKGCGGPSVAKLTALGPQELALGCTLFVARGKHSARALSKELPPTQREAFDDARALLDKNPALTRALSEAPERLIDGEFDLARERPLFGGLFGKKKHDDDLSLAELEAMLATAPPKKPAKKKDRATDELASLVDEALASARAEAD